MTGETIRRLASDKPEAPVWGLSPLEELRPMFAAHQAIVENRDRYRVRFRFKRYPELCRATVATKTVR